MPKASKRVVAIVGAGPNLGAATARTFGSRGFAVGLVARNADRLSDLGDRLEAEGIETATAVADVRTPGSIEAALGAIASRLGQVDVAVYSPLASTDWIKPATETTPEDMSAALELAVVGAVRTVRSVLADMLAAGSGTILLTTGGAAVRPTATRASSAVANAAEVTYARMLHEQIEGSGVHVAHVAIVGALGPGLTHEPDTIAELLWAQHTERDRFQVVVGG